MGGCKSLMLFFGGFSFVLVGKRTRDFAFVSLCYGRSGEEICTGYAMAASGRMQYDYKQTNKRLSLFLIHFFWLAYSLPGKRPILQTRARTGLNQISSPRYPEAERNR